MTRFSVDFDGVSQLGAMFDKLAGKGMEPIVNRALVQVSQNVLNASKAIVPVDTGTLKNSGRVEKPKSEGSLTTVEITYGGAASQYALIVHENPSATHKGGQTYHYLKIPFDAATPTFERDIKERLLKYLRAAQ